METTLRNKLKGVIRAKVEGYLKENSIKFIRKPLNEMTQRIKTKQEQIKALTDQVKVLQGILGKLGSEKADEV